MGQKITNFVLVVLLLIGIGLLAYPSLSNYWNSKVQSKAIASYIEEVDNLDENEYDKIIKKAQTYNEQLLTKYDRWEMSDSEKREYNSILDISGTGVMGYIEIPSINVSLPIYHGTSKDVLQVAIGHVEGSSLPIKGQSTHVVLSGHRGLPSAELFSKLDKVVVGDEFTIQVLNEVYTYEVDQILIVKPYEMSPLAIEDGKEYCTLITCTPYGVNTHRILVRGHRMETEDEKPIIKVLAEASQFAPEFVAPFISIPILFVLLLILIFKKTED